MGLGVVAGGGAGGYSFNGAGFGYSTNTGFLTGFDIGRDTFHVSSTSNEVRICDSPCAASRSPRDTWRRSRRSNSTPVRDSRGRALPETSRSSTETITRCPFEITVRRRHSPFDPFRTKASKSHLSLAFVIRPLRDGRAAVGVVVPAATDKTPQDFIRDFPKRGVLLCRPNRLGQRLRDGGFCPRNL